VLAGRFRAAGCRGEVAYGVFAPARARGPSRASVMPPGARFRFGATASMGVLGGGCAARVCPGQIRETLPLGLPVPARPRPSGGTVLYAVGAALGPGPFADRLGSRPRGSSPLAAPASAGVLGSFSCRSRARSVGLGGRDVWPSGRLRGSGPPGRLGGARSICAGPGGLPARRGRGSYGRRGPGGSERQGPDPGVLAGRFRAAGCRGEVAYGVFAPARARGPSRAGEGVARRGPVSASGPRRRWGCLGAAVPLGCARGRFGRRCRPAFRPVRDPSPWPRSVNAPF